MLTAEVFTKKRDPGIENDTIKGKKHDSNRKLNLPDQWNKPSILTSDGISLAVFCKRGSKMSTLPGVSHRKTAVSVWAVEEQHFLLIKS